MTKRKSFLNALKWSYALNWGQKGFAALFTVILAGILGPKDFGTVSIAVVYIGFLQMFLDQGFMAALVQRKDLEPEHLDAVFWIDQVLSVFLVAVSILLSGWWAARNHAPEIAKIISVLSLSIPIEGLAAVQGAVLTKEMDFKSLSIRTNAATLISGVVGLAMAFTGFGVWALVGQQLVRDSSALVLLWIFSSWRPRFRFSWKHLHELTGFSVSNFLAQLGIYADMQAASLVLGLLFGPVAVGLYRIGDRVTNAIVVIAMASIQSVSFPEFSRFQDNPEELRRSALTCLRLSATTSLPALAGLAAVSGALMATIGPQWVPATGVVKILSILGMLLIFAFFTGPLLQALSKPRLFAILEWARMAIGTGSLVVAGFLVKNGPVKAQISGIATARFLSGGLLVTPVFLLIFMKLCKISVREFVTSIGPSSLASVAVVGSVALFNATGWLASGKPLFLLAAEVAVGGVTGLAVLFRFDAQLRGFCAGLLQRAFGQQLISKEPI
jgi:O-antigen/teichoic acid export membrane protein